MKFAVWSILTVLLTLIPSFGGATQGVLDKDKVLTEQIFLDNRDWDWYKSQIPFLDAPDPEVVRTYYYRWELLTKHLVYGSINSGYAFTEFMDRPFWSGTFGSIACAAGHQLYESRWLRNGRIAWDFARYWYKTPGAEPRKMSGWLVDGAWSVHLVHPDTKSITELLPNFVKNFEGWEREKFSSDPGLFWTSGHDDGMEFNVNSQQTKDILHGAEGFRPTLNSYLWADASAIAQVAALAGSSELAERFQKTASKIKKNMLASLWDSKRHFFFPMSRNDEDLDGHKVRAHTLTHQTGKFAGNSHGRELLGYVPWQFRLPDDEEKFSAAWRFLMDPEFFFGAFGPTTLERRDPLFIVKKDWCCWWSGQSWPYGTSQTLKGLGNLLQFYHQSVITKSDYFKLLKTYSLSHRKSGLPYLAEALDADTGSFEGHDAYNHSEHYFHSGFVDLIVTGLAGLEPTTVNGDEDVVRIHPLIPEEWNYFAMEDIPYHGKLVSILWDKDGSKYHHGSGLSLWVGGVEIGRRRNIGPLEGLLGAKLQTSPDNKGTDLGEQVPINFAINNDGEYFPRIYSSFDNQEGILGKLIDGNFWYEKRPPNRWTTEGSDLKKDWIVIDLGTSRKINVIKLYFLEDVAGVKAPIKYDVEWKQNGAWTKAAGQKRNPPQAMGHRANVISIIPVLAQEFRISFTHANKAGTGLTEIELWGNAKLPVNRPPMPVGNLAFSEKGSSFPKMAASFTSEFDKISDLNDGKIVFTSSPHNRWTSFGSPNSSDWVEVDFGQPKDLSRLELAFYDDGGGVKAPASFTLDFDREGQWTPIPKQSRTPKRPRGGMLNTVSFSKLATKRVRIVMTHQPGVQSGLSEVLAW